MLRHRRGCNIGSKSSRYLEKFQQIVRVLLMDVKEAFHLFSRAELAQKMNVLGIDDNLIELTKLCHQKVEWS